VEATRVEAYVEGREFPTGKAIFGVLVTAFGLLIYYLLPRALVNEDMGQLLLIFFLILQALLIGLIILAFSIQYLL
jgi:ABC-type antimicrobial peptide transport system permease subunit